MDLSDYIIKQIHEKGPISFQEFMELSLYYPEMGYYTSAHEIIGRQGDFYTSATLTPAFGATIAIQLEEIWRIMGGGEFTIVEYGAGTGDLCKSILDYLKDNEKMYAQLRYCIIEKSREMRNLEAKHLPDKVEWCSSILEIKGLNGCVLSNELLDNFAVHRVMMQEELMEVYVDYQHGFTEILRPAPPELKKYFTELNVVLPFGYCTEVNTQAIAWITEIASALNSGYVITIDYGYENPTMYSASKSEGSLLCYYKHSINDSPYLHIGEQDLTCHVNFSALEHWGNKVGLSACGITNQNYFLMSLGFREQLVRLFSKDNNVLQAAAKVAAISHTLLMDMGSKYKVLIQQKGLNGQKLTGLACAIKSPL
ncbi:class I SAM-dependent methyltransferase [Pedobacter nyackensis]|uniref:SAM-dependent methyltransferase, MidA family n=1 Tax=Pedobacter nyackensis TaxID=475255 RepID=A0A1W2DBZ4_9SPHI|nr:SAM-dependent methyltransferase [Pedobacter nyackensis]SMC94652.1 SAM-dependent methyltransferase, MidA family [Pedobacter nyackensis]